MKKCLVALVLAPVFIGPANAKCNYVGPLRQGEEPRCLVTSDGKGQPYIDDRTRRADSARRWQIIQRRQAFRQGAAHTQDMASGGTRTSSGIVVSPFVPGSAQDKGWQAERKRRGLCGNDRLCLNQ